MRVLLDTHAVIWWVDQDSLLSIASHAAIADPANELLVSAATVWEIAIKLDQTSSKRRPAVVVSSSQTTVWWSRARPRVRPSPVRTKTLECPFALTRAQP